MLRSIASYDTREENTGVGLGDALRDLQEYITAPWEDHDNAGGDRDVSDAERPLLDNDSAHEDESQHKAFIRRRTMTVWLSGVPTLLLRKSKLGGCMVGKIQDASIPAMLRHGSSWLHV